MNLDLDILTDEAEAELRERGLIGPGDPNFISWMERKELPAELIEALKRISPKDELWAGAGTVYPEARIVAANDDFPAAIESKLLIVGCAANGDPIAIDYGPGNGATGYISHEEMRDAKDIREVFISVGKSIGAFLYHSNLGDDGAVPDDYWDAKEGQGIG